MSSTNTIIWTIMECVVHYEWRCGDVDLMRKSNKYANLQRKLQWLDYNGGEARSESTDWKTLQLNLCERFSTAHWYWMSGCVVFVVRPSVCLLGLLLSLCPVLSLVATHNVSSGTPPHNIQVSLPAYWADPVVQSPFPFPHTRNIRHKMCFVHWTVVRRSAGFACCERTRFAWGGWLDDYVNEWLEMEINEDTEQTDTRWKNNRVSAQINKIIYVNIVYAYVLLHLECISVLSCFAGAHHHVRRQRNDMRCRSLARLPFARERPTFR